MISSNSPNIRVGSYLPLSRFGLNTLDCWLKYDEEPKPKGFPFNYIAKSVAFSGSGIANALKRNRATEEKVRSSTPSENTMRSERVFAAMAHVPNRFLLTKLAAMATRKLHRPNTRIQETMDEVFVRFSRANPMAGAQKIGGAQPLHRAESAERQSRHTYRSQAVA